MQDENATQLLSHVMQWTDVHDVTPNRQLLQLLAAYKYDEYQRFRPGRKFIESLALWLNQFQPEDRDAALRLVTERVVFISDPELSHLVDMAYPDVVVQERIRFVAEEYDISSFRVTQIANHPRFEELRVKTLYLGLSDGARTSEMRRASNNEISNEQIWHAYELGEEKARDMQEELQRAIAAFGRPDMGSRFNIVWLLDDFSGSGNTYIRYDEESGSYKGKIKKVYERLAQGDLVDTAHHEVFLLLYTATRQAIDHIEYWAERFTLEHGYKPLQLRVLCPLEDDLNLKATADPAILRVLDNHAYVDHDVSDKHFRIGGTNDPRYGFAGCALPVVLAHNTPNNSVYILWGPEGNDPFGLFPRASRHREF